MKKIFKVVALAITLSTTLCFADTSCPQAYSVEERNMILDEASLIMSHSLQPSVCMQKIIDQRIEVNKSLGRQNLKIEDIVSELASAAWKAEVSEKDAN